MSGLLLVNLKRKNLNYEQMNALSRRLIELALKENIGISFNCSDYGTEIIESEKMNCYFHISNSFLYKNCDFLDIPRMISELCGVDDAEKIDFDHYPSKSQIQEAFLNYYDFLVKIIDCIFEYDVTLIEVFVTNCFGTVIYSDEFETIMTTRETLLLDMFHSLTDELQNGFNYEFPSAKIVLSK